MAWRADALALRARFRHRPQPRFAAKGLRLGFDGARFRTPGVVLGSAAFVLGLLTFANFQTQFLFQDHWRDVLRAGVVPRNDGGIFFGALLAAAGLALVMFAMSPRPVKERFGPALLFAGVSAFLLFAHFSIFVNGLVQTQANAASVQASFAFHESAAAIPVATFILAMVTLLLLLGAVLAAIALVAPALLRQHITTPAVLGAHRMRVALATLAYMAFGAGFLRAFTGFALDADADPEGGFLDTNLLVVYYLLVITLAAALVITGWRAYSILWGDLRDKPSRRFIRGYAYLVHTETWLWGIMLALTALVLAASPVYQPPAGTDRVFAMNSKGVSMFFALVLGLYALQRMVSRSYLRFLRAARASLTVVRRDALWWMAAVLVSGWFAISLLLTPTDLSPLTKLIVRYAFVALVMPFFAVRLDLGDLVRPVFRTQGGPLVLLTSALVSILVGIMLWGAGNSVVTIYSRAGGFVTPEGSVLQPYATGIRLLGSLFIATPLTLSLWFLALRYQLVVNPGPLIVVGLSITVAMNLLFTINAEAVTDNEIRASEVLIGFAIIGLSTLFDKVVVTLIWAATAAIGIIAMATLLKRGVDRPLAPIPSVG